MTSVNGSVGGVLVRTQTLMPTVILFHHELRYGWAGSAPGPVSPRDWLEVSTIMLPPL